MSFVTSSAVIALCTTTLIWGLSWTGFRFLQQEAGLHPLWATAIIFSASAIWMLLLNRPSWRTIRQYPELVFILIATGLSYTASYYALVFGNVVRVTLLFYLLPVWTAILGHFILHEPMTRRTYMRVICSFAGAMIVLYQPNMGMPLPICLAEWIALLSGICYAFNTVMLRRLRAIPKHIRTIAMFTGAALLSSILGTVLACLGLIPYPVAPQPLAISILALWSILLTVSNLCLQYGVARLPANISGVILLFEIVISALAAWLLGVSHLRPQDLIGGALIVIAPLLFRE